MLARLEVFASRQPPAAAFIDGVSCGLGMALALMLLATGRELLGTGKIAGLLNIPGFDGVPFRDFAGRRFYSVRADAGGFSCAPIDAFRLNTAESLGHVQAAVDR